uniref:(northern house mosquito) hypothetical protein n=1 Tax=Culex pipiens TaxID=7175 RepID=A0A8D8P7I4_CULPI
MLRAFRTLRKVLSFKDLLRSQVLRRAPVINRLVSRTGIRLRRQHLIFPTLKLHVLRTLPVVGRPIRIHLRIVRDVILPPLQSLNLFHLNHRNRLLLVVIHNHQLVPNLNHRRQRLILLGHLIGNILRRSRSRNSNRKHPHRRRRRRAANRFRRSLQLFRLRPSRRRRHRTLTRLCNLRRPINQQILIRVPDVLHTLLTVIRDVHVQVLQVVRLFTVRRRRFH